MASPFLNLTLALHSPHRYCVSGPNSVLDEASSPPTDMFVGATYASRFVFIVRARFEDNTECVYEDLLPGLNLVFVSAKKSKTLNSRKYRSSKMTDVADAKPSRDLCTCRQHQRQSPLQRSDLLVTWTFP